MLALCIAFPAACANAQSAAAGTAPTDLYRQGNYEAAATRGLRDLLAQPWNHQLRLIVADSLQRIGRHEEAKAQLEALEGTPLAAAAKTRLRALPSDRQQRVQPTLEVPQYQPVSPVSSASPVAAPMQLAQVAAPIPYVPTAGASRPQYISPSGSAIAIEPRTAPPGASGNMENRLPETAPPAVAVPAGPVRSAGAQRVIDLNAAEKYHEAGTAGLALLASEKPDDETRMIIANALAWTGRLKEAEALYQELLGGKLANRARIGIANLHRWTGQGERALAIYEEVLVAEPGNPDAQEGRTLARRELRPKTTLTVGGFVDSSDVHRKQATLNHRWREDKSGNLVEVEASGVRDTLAPIQSNSTLR